MNAKVDPIMYKIELIVGNEPFKTIRWTTSSIGTIGLSSNISLILSGNILSSYIIGDRKKPACNNICQINFISFIYTLRIESINETPSDKKKRSTNNNGKSTAVDGGMNLKMIRKTPNAANSNIIMIKAVRHELITMISRLK